MSSIKDVAADVAAQSEINELRAALSKAQRAVSQSRAKSAGFVEATYAAARHAYLAHGGYKPIVPPPADRRKKGKPEVALWHLTDWQCGKKTASYDMAVMDERVRRFATKAVHIADIQRADHPVRHCIILLGGDFVENTTTFPGQEWEVEAHTFEQMFTAGATLEAVIRVALETFETVQVIGEPGNHGRVGRPGDAPRGDNWDRVLYKVVTDRFATEPRFTYVNADSWHQRFSIGNYHGILVHGDEFKGFGGQTPMFGILRKSNAWKSGVIKGGFQDIYVGHFHNHNDLTLAAGGSVFMTGSPESDNEYAREFVAAAAIPSQRLHFIDPDKGRVTAQYRIELA